MEVAELWTRFPPIGKPFANALLRYCPHISGHLDCLLNLNSQTVLLRFDGDFHSSFVFTPTQNGAIVADKTFRFNFRVTLPANGFATLIDLVNFPRERLRALVVYVLERCPNVKQISIGYVRP